MSSPIRIHRGLDIPIAGALQQSIHPGQPIQHVALCGFDYPGLKPKLLVTPGDRVGFGQPLFIDKRDPEVVFVSPGQGTVVAINRGPRRALESVVVRLADFGIKAQSFSPLTDQEIQHISGRNAASRLQQSGLWSAFRTRPFSHVPRSDQQPHSIFVTAMDTAPLAADPQIVIRPQAAAFARGLLAVSKLTEGSVYLCTAPGWDIPLPELESMQRVEFFGPHPAGLPGTHIHYLDPVGANRMVWHIGYQDVIAIGRLFSSGEIYTRRVLSLAGDSVTKPRLVVSRLGASTDEMVNDEIADSDSCRVISGSLLTGHTASGSHAYLGRYHHQLSVIREGGGKSLFGWLNRGRRHYKATSFSVGRADRSRKWAFTTSQNGRFSGMLPLPIFEKIMPLDILPSALFRALMVKDTEQAQALGCLELDEEDLALCSFVCPAKSDYGAALRLNLELIEREG